MVQDCREAPNPDVVRLDRAPLHPDMGHALEKYNLAWLEDMIPWMYTDIWRQITQSIVELGRLDLRALDYVPNEREIVMKSNTRTMPALLTYEDYCQIPDDGNRYEVIDGVLHMSPSPAYRHQRLVVKLSRKLDGFVEEHGLGKIVVAPFDILFSDSNIVQPDILFISQDRASIITEKNAQGVPDLLVEILSSSNRRYDEVVKKQLYENYGVREYWIVDPEEDTVRQYELDGRVLKLSLELSRQQGEELTSSLLPGFRCELSWLFDV